MEFYKKLRIVMAKKGLSCKELACIIGVSQETISAWNKPKVILRRENAELLVAWSVGEISLKDCGINRAAPDKQ
jgi:DNA-binding XRE family transcriptional regulator